MALIHMMSCWTVCCLQYIDIHRPYRQLPYLGFTKIAMKPIIELTLEQIKTLNVMEVAHCP